MAFGTQLDDQPEGVKQAHKTQWNAITDLYQSIGALNSKVEGAKSSTVETIENISTVSETVVVQSSTYGSLNNQIGNTSYTTLPSDAGTFILLGASSPIAVALSTFSTSPAITLPWATVFINTGTSVATLTPASGTIYYPNNPAASSMPIPPGDAVSVVFDGENFWGVTFPVPPQNTPQITSLWLNSYNNETGAFGQSQPATSDLSDWTDAGVSNGDVPVWNSTTAKWTPGSAGPSSGSDFSQIFQLMGA
jgi:hypothetical protein